MKHILKKDKAYILIIALLQLLDFTTTYIGITYLGLIEANPIAEIFVDKGALFLFIFKVLATFIVIALSMGQTRRYKAYIALFSIVVINNTYHILTGLQSGF
jgi:uncharacterized membrane protein